MTLHVHSRRDELRKTIWTMESLSVFNDIFQDALRCTELKPPAIDPVQTECNCWIDDENQRSLRIQLRQL